MWPLPFLRALTLEFFKGDNMHIFLAMDPPTITGQMRKVRVVKGKPVFYDPPEIKEVRQTFQAFLSLRKPDQPMEGPLALRVLWLFPKGKSHKDGEWKTNRPDTDNLEKLLKDCMTDVGFWKDDAQVCSETIEKRWAEPCGIYIEVEELNYGTE